MCIRRKPGVMPGVLLGLFILAGPAFAGEGGGYPQAALPPLAAIVQNGTGTVSYTPGTGTAFSTSTETVDVQGSGFAYSGTVGADATASNSPVSRSSFATTGGSGAATGKGPLSVTNAGEAMTFQKGMNGISISEATVYVTVTVNGRQYVVAQEMAMALARTTQFGSSTATYAAGSLPAGGAYTSTQVITSKAGSR